MPLVVEQKNPLVWLRLAECCILSREQEGDSNEDLSDENMGNVDDQACSEVQFKCTLQRGTGWKRFMLRCLEHQCGFHKQNSDRKFSCDLPHAVIYITNALDLIASSRFLRSGSDKIFCDEMIYDAPSGAIPDVNTDQRSIFELLQLPRTSVGDSLLAFIDKNKAVEQICFIKLAYTHLRLLDPSRCLKAIRDAILCGSPLSSNTRTILSFYAAEAYCRIGDLRQAEKFCQPEFMTAIGAQNDIEENWLSRNSIDAACECTYSRSRTVKNSKVTVFEAIKLCNRAAVLCCQGLLTDALQLISQVLESNAKFLPAIRTLVYINLRIGNRANAIAALQKFGIKSP